jgi:two-component system, chemotaxis family, chemotaxis protein CheY
MSKIVLIVDDSASTRKMIDLTLIDQGLDFIEASNGKEACSILNEELYFIITDLNMPLMNGLDFIRAVRTSEKNRFTPVIMLTTEAEKEKQEEGKKAGATAWLVKPFSPEILLETIIRIVV